MSRNKEHRPNGSAAQGGRPLGGTAFGGASVFFVSAHLSFSIMNIYENSLYIPYIIYIIWRSPINTPVWGKHFRYRTRRRKNSFCCPSRIQQKLKLQRFSAPMQARAATSKAARPNRIQQARFDAYGNQWLAIAGVCPIPNVLNKNQIFL